MGEAMLKRLIAFIAALFLLITLLPLGASVPFVAADSETADPFAAEDSARERKLSLMQEGIPREIRAGSLGTRPPTASAASGEKRYIVGFRKNSSKTDISGVLKDERYSLIGSSDNRLACLVTADLDDFLAKAGDLVDQVEEDFVIHAQRAVDDPYAPDQWALDSMKLRPAWNRTIGSVGFYIAVLDTGFNRQHPDFQPGHIRAGWDYLNWDHVYTDPNGHGTNVTGVIAAAANNSIGVAGTVWRSAVIPFRVLDANGDGYVSDAVGAIYDAADMGCRVINLSLGHYESLNFEEEAVRYAQDKGAIVVAAAGNDNSSQYSYPASYEGVFSVGAVTSEHLRAGFSNYNDRVDLVAPGQSVLTTDGSRYYGYASGTSFSSPYVAGVAALAVSLRPKLTAAQFLEAVKATSRDLGPRGYDVKYGHGLVDASALLAYLDVSFPDVIKASWYHGYVINLARQGIVNGYSTGTFRPSYGVRRDHASKMIAVAAGLNYKGKRADFPDVAKTDEMSPYIAALAEEGAIRGYPDGTFRPKKQITREQICQITAKAFHLEMGDLPADFTDLSPNEEIRGYVLILASNGIVKGIGGSEQFDPRGDVTRAQMTKILSIAMAVSAIQKAETAMSQEAVDAAQALVDFLPENQDLDTRDYLQARIDAIQTP